jgi:hypothetical protein
MKKNLFGGTILLLFSVLLLLGLSDCNRKYTTEDIVVSGRVLEYGTNEPVPNATVYGLECEGQVLGNINCYRSDSATSDPTGHYALSGYAEWTRARADGYWPSDDVPVLYQKEGATDVSLYPHAWLRVKIRNESGAWGFYPESEQSGLPPIQIPQGRDTILSQDIKIKAQL